MSILLEIGVLYGIFGSIMHKVMSGAKKSHIEQGEVEVKEGYTQSLKDLIHSIKDEQ